MRAQPALRRLSALSRAHAASPADPRSRIGVTGCCFGPETGESRRPAPDTRQCPALWTDRSTATHRSHTPLFLGLEAFVLTMLVLEVSIRMCAQRRKFWAYPWNVFDVCVTLLCTVAVCLYFAAPTTASEVEDAVAFFLSALRYAAPSLRLFTWCRVRHRLNAAAGGNDRVEFARLRRSDSEGSEAGADLEFQVPSPSSGPGSGDIARWDVGPSSTASDERAAASSPASAFGASAEPATAAEGTPAVATTTTAPTAQPTSDAREREGGARKGPASPRDHASSTRDVLRSFGFLGRQLGRGWRSVPARATDGGEGRGTATRGGDSGWRGARGTRGEQGEEGRHLLGTPHRSGSSSSIAGGEAAYAQAAAEGSGGGQRGGASGDEGPERRGEEVGATASAVLPRIPDVRYPMQVAPGVYDGDVTDMLPAGDGDDWVMDDTLL